MNALADVYSWRGRILVTSLSKATSGWWIVDGSVALPPDPSDAELGAAVAAAVRASRTGVPAPAQGEEAPASMDFLRLAGATSWEALNRRAWVASVQCEDDRYSVSSTRRLRGGGREGGYAEQLLDSPSEDEIGRAVRAALAKSEAGNLK